MTRFLSSFINYWRTGSGMVGSWVTGNRAMGNLAVRRQLGVLAITLSLISCTPAEAPEALQQPEASGTSEATPSNIANSPKTVLTTFTILEDMAQNVAGDALTVDSITRIGAEIHGYEPVPSDIAKAQDADLILYNGMNLERWFEQFLGSVKGVPSAVLSEGVEPIAIAQGPYSNKPNPHAWMSPRNALQYVENIRQAFVELDPTNADTYNTNAAAYSQQIEAIDAELRTALATVPEAQRYLVSCEGAFSYLARDYGLKEIYIWPINAEQQSTPKQLKTVIDQVKANQVPAVFCESTANAESQKEIAKATGATFGGNLYVDSLSPPTGPVPTYLEMLQYDADLIIKGLTEKTP
jgi:ABC-type Zn uptake system ZnuABC Zn-binding protein ZnuA